MLREDMNQDPMPTCKSPCSCYCVLTGPVYFSQPLCCFIVGSEMLVRRIKVLLSSFFDVIFVYVMIIEKVSPFESYPC